MRRKATIEIQPGAQNLVESPPTGDEALDLILSWTPPPATGDPRSVAELFNGIGHEQSFELVVRFVRLQTSAASNVVVNRAP